MLFSTFLARRAEATAAVPSWGTYKLKSNPSRYSLAARSSRRSSARYGVCQEAREKIEGRVTDGSGAVVPGFPIRLTHLATNATRATNTNSAGAYSAPLLTEGVYRIVAEKEGFKQLVREGVEVRINDVREVDLALEVGQATQSVTVSAEAPLLQSEIASVGQVVSAKGYRSCRWPSARLSSS